MVKEKKVVRCWPQDFRTYFRIALAFRSKALNSSFIVPCVKKAKGFAKRFEPAQIWLDFIWLSYSLWWRLSLH